MTDKRGSDVGAVDEYLAKTQEDAREMLQKLRKIIKSAAPDAEEVISYKMPAFRQNGMLVWYAAFEDHCTLFAGNIASRKEFAAELRPYLSGKSAIHFTRERPLPEDLVRRIVKMRLAENAARAKRRSMPGARRGKRRL